MGKIHSSWVERGRGGRPREAEGRPSVLFQRLSLPHKRRGGGSDDNMRYNNVNGSPLPFPFFLTKLFFFFLFLGRCDSSDTGNEVSVQKVKKKDCLFFVCSHAKPSGWVGGDDDVLSEVAMVEKGDGGLIPIPPFLLLLPCSAVCYRSHRTIISRGYVCIMRGLCCREGRRVGRRGGITCCCWEIMARSDALPIDIEMDMYCTMYGTCGTTVELR